MSQDIAGLDAKAAGERIANGDLTAERYVQAGLDRIAAREDTLKAWAFLDPELALEQARARDKHHSSGLPLGRLHGVPVGIKDIVDTADMPTENGTVLDSGRQPGADSAVAARIRAQGGIIMGKTVTTELAVFHPGKTTNPHDPGHTPGGSSSGSAAAVGAQTIPLSIGTQTTGSTIRPASFCGIFGYKPSHGAISRAHTLLQSPPLDTVGLFANSIRDLALLGDCLIGHDPADPGSSVYNPAVLERSLAAPGPAKPKFGFVKTPVWEKADSDVRSAFDRLADWLGGALEETALPPAFLSAHDGQRCLMIADFAKNLGPYYERGKDKLSALLCDLIEQGQKISAVEYNKALDLRRETAALADELTTSYDALVTPAVTGEAPKGLETTGDPAFCAIWTFTGSPAVNLPLFEGANGLPIGLQVIGRRGLDGRLMQAANWLWERLSDR
jgi:Asp-tRNA(Asn)/Glu-tRNA(Gln) amidotransferase A subunit family amidase